MKVDVRHFDDVIIVDLEGRLVGGVGDELLREVVNELLAEGWKKIVINLKAVSLLDSSGIGELVEASRARIAEAYGTTADRVKIMIDRHGREFPRDGGDVVDLAAEGVKLYIARAVDPRELAAAPAR